MPIVRSVEIPFILQSPTSSDRYFFLKVRDHML